MKGVRAIPCGGRVCSVDPSANVLSVRHVRAACGTICRTVFTTGHSFNKKMGGVRDRALPRDLARVAVGDLAVEDSSAAVT